MLVLFESSLGFCLFKVADNGKLLSDDQLYKKFETPASASNLVKLQSIHRFQSTADAVEDMSAIGEGKLSKNLKNFLIEEISGGVEGKKSKETLAVVDPKLGGAITKKLGFNVISDSTTTDLFRGIRSQLAPLLGEYNVEESDLNTMNLGLSHSLSRFKLKYSTDKVDTMIVQAIALLDDLDKEVNIYAMRVKEWYGWHFPEMSKIITDNLAYAKVVKAMGDRTDHDKTDFSEILPEELEGTLKAAAAISMGTEISDTDLHHIKHLASQVISLMQYRTELFEYLRNRMTAIAPNLTAILGELVGARLIAHSGSLINLAKAPASTIQILGAEKALFRALKTKHDTPKYGLIFHSSLVGSAPGKLKGKMARMTAAKAALSIRHDALADADTKSSEDAPLIGIEARIKLESRLRRLEQSIGIQSVRKSSTAQQQLSALRMPNTGSYNPAADDIMIPAANVMKDVTEEEQTGKKEKKQKKKKPLIEEIDSSEKQNGDVTMAIDEDEEAVAKRLKKEAKQAKKAARASTGAITESEPTKSKKRKNISEDVDQVEEASEPKKSEKKIKKKKSKATTDE
ncbi:hypothetical protein CROQUDRAFT_76470 [Cronartium quercuum f. sp. fusiforme G11]|uniref:Nucleolar protein 58 n=1 Tax=Cronartium quercuum f. sp. fusiforme G11 TaxID=708437 RepID=A0A9P6NKC6_9BASI|nr:hypothetical protein CROQUDRAFT_76470 [Cronartium quercuum f. sp. fusiforme G11]